MTNSESQEMRHPPVFRTLHSIIMWSILILVATGFYIHYPFMDGGGFLMSLVRGVHFLSAAILIVSTVTRIVMMFVGKNRDWSSLVLGLRDIALMPKVIAHYLHFAKEPKLSKKYNPLQMITYFGVFILILFQILSGLALLFPDSFMAWFNYGIFGNEVNSRIWHYIINWVLVIFLMIHLYLTIRQGRVEEAKDIKQMHSVTEAE
ncbi:MAG: cytochrome b/b6 domain-containing protein [Dehalococcoidales bacterium]|nr:cytochrome b/b6 domain-containing protein [Dehalococcoidales bacterium]